MSLPVYLYFISSPSKKSAPLVYALEKITFFKLNTVDVEVLVVGFIAKYGFSIFFVGLIK